MSDVGLPIEKSSVSMSVFNYDFKVSYYPESDECKVLYKATIEAAGYDLYAAEEKEILPKTNAIVSHDLRIAIPKGFFRKNFSRSGLFLNDKITAEAGVTTLDFEELFKFSCSIIQIKIFYAKKGDRIAQILFLEKFDVKFEMAQSRDLLPKSTRNENGFGSTGGF